MKPIFSGDDSHRLWKRINKLLDKPKRKRKKLAEQVFWALYLLGCKCQELEAVVEKLDDASRPEPG